MPKYKYTEAERKTLGISSNKRKGEGSNREDREFYFDPYAEPEEIFETRGRPQGTKQDTSDSDLSWVLAAGFVVLIFIIVL